MLPQQYCLRWKHHHTNVQSMFSQLLEKERFCDVTLYCSPSFGAQLSKEPAKGEDKFRGVSLRAHRVVLAACSELLGSLLGAHDADGAHGAEPVLVIDGAEPRHVRALLDYMYTGEMNVHHSQLASLLKTAEELRIKGLSDIRWSGKDEPPDSKSGAITAVPAAARDKPTKRDAHTETPKQAERFGAEPAKQSSHAHSDAPKQTERFNVNGGPPPLIKLPCKPQEKGSPTRKRDAQTDGTEGQSPKRQRITSGTDNTDDDDREQDWQHGNMDITAEQVVGWGGGRSEGSEGSAGAGSDDEWADAPHDLSSFLHTRLEVDGDNSDDDSNYNGRVSLADVKPELTLKPMSQMTAMTQMHCTNMLKPAPLGPKSGPCDPRFADVVKLSEYLLHGRRPQFWEEDYVRRVMEAVRLKELEMKQAAEILGVSYGTLYGRYRDVYGCINRPYRMGYPSGTEARTSTDHSIVKEFWQEKGPAEILARLQRGEVTLTAAAEALAVSPNNLAAYLAGMQPYSTSKEHQDEEEFEPIPIEIDPSLKNKVGFTTQCPIKSIRKNVAAAEKAVKKIIVGSMVQDEEGIPANVIQREGLHSRAGGAGIWPSIRIASIESLRAAETATTTQSTTTTVTSPSALMKNRPDLTIVAAKRSEPAKDEIGT